MTGGSGRAGRNLAAILSGEGRTGVGGDLSVDTIPSDDPLRSQAQLLELDVRQEDRITEVLTELRPDTIYHMAAVVPIRIALETPAAPFETNVIGTANLLEAVRKAGLNPPLVIAGSSVEYGSIYSYDTSVT